jgi:hypothetical protein
MRKLSNCGKEILMINSGEILAFYEMFDEDDISTERLLALVADAADCCVSDVVSVLACEHEEKQKKSKKRRA